MNKIYSLLLLLAATVFNTAHAQYFTLTDSLALPTLNQQSQKLNNGTVLTFGGENGSFSDPNNAYSSAEIYSNGVWTTTGSMNLQRTQFASVILPSGKVMALGGIAQDENEEWASCEIYDPATGHWTYTDSMPEATTQEGAVVLNNGNVLEADGDSSFVYTTSTGHWGSNVSMAAGHGLGPALVLLQSGKVLAVGGSDCLTCGDVYDPSNNTWTLTANQLHYSHVQTTAILLNNGKVLIYGSSSIDSGQTTSELYDPVTNSFSVSGNLLNNVASSPAVLLDNGNVLVWSQGNIFGTGNNSDVIQVYNTGNGTWSAVPSNQLGTSNNTLVKMSNNQVLVIAGQEFGGPVPYCWLINGNLTGINDITPVGSFGLTPNPGSNSFVVNAGQLQQATTMRIYNLQGQLMQEIKHDFAQPVNTTQLAAGSYLVMLYDKDNQPLGARQWIKAGE